MNGITFPRFDGLLPLAERPSILFLLLFGFLDTKFAILLHLPLLEKWSPYKPAFSRHHTQTYTGEVSNERLWTMIIRAVHVSLSPFRRCILEISSSGITNTRVRKKEENSAVNLQRSFYPVWKSFASASRRLNYLMSRKWTINFGQLIFELSPPFRRHPPKYGILIPSLKF